MGSNTVATITSREIVQQSLFADANTESPQKAQEKVRVKPSKTKVYVDNQESNSQYHLAEAKRLAKQMRRIGPSIRVHGTARIQDQQRGQATSKQLRQRRKLEEQKVGQAICQHLLAHLKTVH